MPDIDHSDSRTIAPFPWRNLVFVAGVAAVYQGFLFFAYPLTEGPDGWSYFAYWDQLRSGEVYSPFIMRLRTPCYPLFLGSLMAVFGENGTALVLIHHLLGVLFSILFFLSLRRFGLCFATIVATVVSVAPQVMDHFHFCSSEPLYLVFLAAALLSIERYIDRRTAAWAIAAGLFISLTASCRPVFGLMSYGLLVYLLIKRSRWWIRVLLIVAWLAPMLGFSTLNYFKQGFFKPQAGGGPALALGTLWWHHISEPDDGPATQQLYVDLADDLKNGRTDKPWSPDIWTDPTQENDLVAEAYRLQALRYSLPEAEARMASVAREAVRKHWFTYGYRVAFQMAKFLRFPSRLMQSWFFDHRLAEYAEAVTVQQQRPSDRDQWIHTRQWPGVETAGRELFLERFYHFRYEIWGAKLVGDSWISPPGNRRLLTILQEWERMILLPGFWLVAFSIAALVFLWRSPHREILLVYGFIVLGHAFVTSMVLHVSNRYVSVILPWYIAAAALGLRAAFQASHRYVDARGPAASDATTGDSDE